LLTEQRIVTGSVQNPSSLRTQMPLGPYAGLRPTIVQRDDDRASIIRVGLRSESTACVGVQRSSRLAVDV